MRQGSPFGIVPTRAVFDERMSPAVLRVLMALATYADEERMCHPAQGTVAKRLHVSRQAVGRCVQQLVALGYIEQVPRYREDGGKMSSAYRIIFDQSPAAATASRTPMQHDVASPQPEDAPMQHDVASHATSRLHPHATSSVAWGGTREPASSQAGGAVFGGGTDQIEQTIRTEEISVEKEGHSSTISFAADATGADGATPDHPQTAPSSSGLVRRVVRAAGVPLVAERVQRLIEQHPQLREDRLIFEVENAAEWIADPQKNKGGKRKMTVAFLHNWLKRAEQPPPPIALVPAAAASGGHAHGNGNGRYAPPEPPAKLRDAREIKLNALPVALN